MIIANCSSANMFICYENFQEYKLPWFAYMHIYLEHFIIQSLKEFLERCLKIVTMYNSFHPKNSW